MKLSLNTCVNLLALNGRCVPLRLNARIHSFNANSDLLISAPSIPANNATIFTRASTVDLRPQIEQITWNSRVCLLAEDVSAPLSLPARSIRENFPWTLSVPGIRAVIWKTAWDRDELEFALVWPLVLALFPCCINFNTSSQVSTTFSVNPSICTYGTGKDRNELNGKREQVNACKRTCCLPSSRTRSFSLSFNKSNTLPE